MRQPGLVLFVALAAAAIAAEPPTAAPVAPLGFAYRPNADDYYPSTSRAMGEQGKVMIRFCYDERGGVTTTALEESSGYERLDQAALRMGKAFRIKPGIIDGQPQAGCSMVIVTFSLAVPAEPQERGEGATPPPVPTVRRVPLNSEPR
jgi:protein TonB